MSKEKCIIQTFNAPISSTMCTINKGTERVVMSSFAGEIREFTADGEVNFSMTVNSEVTCFEIINEYYYLTGDSDGRMTLWIAQLSPKMRNSGMGSGNEIKTWQFEAKILKIIHEKGKIFIIGADGYFRVIDLEFAGKVIHTMKRSSDPLSGMVKLDEQNFIVGSWDGFIWTLDLRTKQMRNVTRASTKPVRCLCGPKTSSARPELRSKLYYAAGLGNQLLSIDMQTNLWTLDIEKPFPVVHKDIITQIKIYKEKLFSSSEDGSICIWDPKLRDLLHTIKTINNVGITSFVILPNIIVAGAFDFCAHAWPLEDTLYQVKKVETKKHEAEEKRIAEETAKEEEQKRLEEEKQELAQAKKAKKGKKKKR